MLIQFLRHGMSEPTCPMPGQVLFVIGQHDFRDPLVRGQAFLTEAQKAILRRFTNYVFYGKLYSGTSKIVFRTSGIFKVTCPGTSEKK